jgi:hypothetical protein
MMIGLVPEVNRAFSAGAFWVPLVLGRCPRLTVNAAPLALKQIPESVSGKTIIAWNSSDVPVPEGRYVRLAYTTSTAILETLCRNFR